MRGICECSAVHEIEAAANPEYAEKAEVPGAYLPGGAVPHLRKCPKKLRIWQDQNTASWYILSAK
jgi:hypothetical protein